MADEPEDDQDDESEPLGVALNLRRFDDDTFAIIIRTGPASEDQPSGFWVQLSRSDLQELVDDGTLLLEEPANAEPPLSTDEAVQQLEVVAEDERRRRRRLN